MPEMPFSLTKAVSERKIAREMLCFTIETAVSGCEGKRCETAVAAMVAYARLWSGRIGPPLGSGQTHCNGGFQVALGCWVADGGAVFWGNVIAGFHGGAVLSGNVIAGGQTHCTGGLQVAWGCRRRRCVIGECHCRFPWWRGVINWGMSLNAGGQMHCNSTCSTCGTCQKKFRSILPLRNSRKEMSCH